MHEITAKLLALSDEKFKEFNKKIVPDGKKPMIGVKIPEIRAIVKQTDDLSAKAFLEIEHKYFEEVMAHGLILAKFCENESDFALLEEFLPEIDNWAVCDITATSIKKLAKNKALLLEYIEKWLKSDKIYTVRFAIVCLLTYFCDSEYSGKVIRLALSVKSDEYYINMAIAWLFSVMLVKDYESAVRLLELKVLPRFIQNKTIDKARDSFRIDKNKKTYLKTLKV